MTDIISHQAELRYQLIPGQPRQFLMASFTMPGRFGIDKMLRTAKRMGFTVPEGHTVVMVNQWGDNDVFDDMFSTAYYIPDYMIDKWYAEEAAYQAEQNK